MMKIMSRSKDSRSGIRGRSIMSFDDFQYTAVNELVFNLNQLDPTNKEETSKLNESIDDEKSVSVKGSTPMETTIAILSPNQKLFGDEEICNMEEKQAENVFGDVNE